MPEPDSAPQSSEEQALVARAIDGDTAALDLLLLEHHDALIRAVKKSIPTAQQALVSAEDVCQEAYAQAFQAIGGFTWNGPGSFAAWLRTIALRRLADALRRLGAAKRGGGTPAVKATGPDEESAVSLLQLLADQQRSPSQSAARREVASLVDRALAQLPTDQERALRMRYFEGLTVAETAERMERSPGAIQMLCSRGLEQIARRLGDPTRFLSRLA